MIQLYAYSASISKIFLIFKEKERDRTRFYVDLARNVTTKIAAHVFQVEMSVKEREQFCKCVNNIIAAYEKKLQEVKGLNDVIRVMKRKSKEKSRKIKQFKQINAELRAQLASSLCQKCGQERVTEMIRSLSMQVILVRNILHLSVFTFKKCFKGRRFDSRSVQVY